MSNTSKNPTDVIFNQEDELRAWFSLLLDLRARGFTPDEVKATFFGQNPIKQKLTVGAIEGGEVRKISEENKSWCW